MAGPIYDTPALLACFDRWPKRTAIAPTNWPRARPGFVVTAFSRTRHDAEGRDDLQPVRDSIGRFRSVLIERFDRVHGGFGSFAKLPHPYALMFAVSLAADGDTEMGEIARVTLDRLQLLWDTSGGGFCRYADSADWSWPASEKTLEDNAALLHVLVDAALRLREPRYGERAATLVRWIRSTMADDDRSGFFNAVSARTIDKTMYVDRNAMVVGALIRAAALFDDVWLKDLGLGAFESVVVPTYKPGDGVGHVAAAGSTGALRGPAGRSDSRRPCLDLGARRNRPASVLDARGRGAGVCGPHDVGRASRRFRDRADADDPLLPFELNCHAACAFDRLAVLTGDRTHQERALTILRSLEGETAEQDHLCGALCAGCSGSPRAASAGRVGVESGWTGNWEMRLD